MQEALRQRDELEEEVNFFLHVSCSLSFFLSSIQSFRKFTLLISLSLSLFQLESSREEGEGLRSEVVLLKKQLADSQNQLMEMSQSLAATKQAMDIYQETARRDVRG